MADVKWIKIATDIFDDEKILLIESLPDADTILVIWFKLLCLAGKQNNSGVFTMANSIPYTDKMLATVFHRNLEAVQKALDTFKNYGMIEVIGDVITIPNWEKHQNIDKLEEIREQTRCRVAKHREKQRNLSCNVTVTEDVTLRNATDKNKNRIDKNKNREGEYIHTHARKHTEEKIKNLYGKFNNVALTDEEYNNLSSEVLNRDKLIGKLSTHIKSSGKNYNDHYATLIKWDSEDREKKQAPDTSQKQNDKYANVMDNIRNKRKNRTSEAVI